VPTDPDRIPVNRTAGFDATVATTFPPERWGSGARPSIDDFERHYYPALEQALEVAGLSSGYADRETTDIREMFVKPVLGVFPPARVAFLVTSEPIGLTLFGIEFDWDYRWDQPEDGTS
jgi:hypothetical protein